MSDRNTLDERGAPRTTPEEMDQILKTEEKRVSDAYPPETVSDDDPSVATPDDATHITTGSREPKFK